jgi:outer membrane immunogenic protein
LGVISPLHQPKYAVAGLISEKLQVLDVAGLRSFFLGAGMKPLGIAGAALAVALTTIQAHGADIARPVYKAPVVAPAYNWTGFYVGGHGGYGWDPASAIFNPVTYAYSVGGPGLGSTLLSGPGNIPLSVDPSGGFGGIQIGYNWQTGAFLFGWEADVSFGKIKDEDIKGFTVVTLTGDILDFTGNVRLQQEVDYFGTVRGRLGWANNTLLIYATGGLAWGHVDTTFQVYNLRIQNNGAVFGPGLAALLAGASAQQDDVRFGYAIGGGFEWAFAPNWSFKADYIFIDLGNGDTLTIPGGTANSDFYMHTVRFGVNLKLGG